MMRPWMIIGLLFALLATACVNMRVFTETEWARWAAAAGWRRAR